MSAGQSRKMSALESLASTAIGFVVAFFAQIFIMGIFGIGSDLMRDLMITVFFTVLSLVRGYCVRRAFNWLQVRRDAEFTS